MVSGFIFKNSIIQNLNKHIIEGVKGKNEVHAWLGDILYVYTTIVLRTFTHLKRIHLYYNIIFIFK